MKVVVVLLALCCIAAAQVDPDLIEECGDLVQELVNATGIDPPQECSAEQVEFCTNGCLGLTCALLTRVSNETARMCNPVFYQACLSIGVEVEQCNSTFNQTVIVDECSDSLDLNHEVFQTISSACVDVASLSPEDTCRECAGPSCLALVGDNAARCRRIFYEGCASIGVELEQCDDSSGLAMVPVKGALALVLLVATFFTF